jgi:hypothetical protein
MSTINFTTFKNARGVLTKKIHLNKDGRLVKDANQCRMVSGTATVVDAGDKPFACLADHINRLESDKAICLGRILDAEIGKNGVSRAFEVTTRAKLNGAAGVIARDQDHVGYEPSAPAFVLLDYDTDAMPDDARARVEGCGGCPQPALYAFFAHGKPLAGEIAV